MGRNIVIAGVFLCTACVSQTQFNWEKAVSAGVKTVQAATLTDRQVSGYVKEYVNWMDANNPVCPDNSPYTVRLRRITKNINNRDGINIKAYCISEANAFASADGSVRVFAGLMDIMTDDEILGVIGHEIGHVKNKDVRDAFRTSLLTSALRDGLGTMGGRVAELSRSQLGDLSESLVNSSYSRKQESEADSYGYEFLKSHGINPWAMALAFEKLKAMQQNTGLKKDGAIRQLFSTHPDLDSRVKEMARRATADGFKRPVASRP